MELAVISKEGKETGRKVSLDDSIYGVDPNDHAIYLDVKQHLANLRQGTHKAKERGEISGSTRKLHRQKGTGGSRKGSIKNPLFRGGGRVFGPRQRDYGFKLNKKVKRLARRSAMSYKSKDGLVMVVEPLNFEQPRTKDFLAMLRHLQLDQKKVLIVVADDANNAFLSARNLPGANVISANELNTYEVMDAETLLIAENTISHIDKLLS